MTRYVAGHQRWLRIVSKAALAAAVLLSTAHPAQAVTHAPGAATGACVPAVQSVPVGTTPAAVSCAFRFVQAGGQPMTGVAVSVATTGDLRLTTAAGTLTDGDGSARVLAANPSCTAVGTQLGTVVAIGTGSGITTQAVALVTCVAGPLVVDQATCVTTGQRPAALLPADGTEFRCAFHTPARGRLAVSFEVSKEHTERSAFIVDQSAQPDSRGNFRATLWNYGPSATVIATVTSTGARSTTSAVTTSAVTTPGGQT